MTTKVKVDRTSWNKKTGYLVSNLGSNVTQREETDRTLIFILHVDAFHSLRTCVNNLKIL